jgi:hypothetical protein
MALAAHARRNSNHRHLDLHDDDRLSERQQPLSGQNLVDQQVDVNSSVLAAVESIPFSGRIVPSVVGQVLE